MIVEPANPNRVQYSTLVPEYFSLEKLLFAPAACFSFIRGMRFIQQPPNKPQTGFGPFRAGSSFFRSSFFTPLCGCIKNEDV